MVGIKNLIYGGVAFAAATVMIHSGAQAFVAYSWDEGGPGNGTNSPYVSFHNANGPVLADDFVPARTGSVSQVTWWGSQADSAQWEITFHNDTVDSGGNHEPAIGPVDGGISQHFVNATGSDADGDGVFKYTAAWTPLDVNLIAGAQYWFSVANGADGWLWANAGGAGPAVGSQNYFAQESVNGAPSVIIGPHDGPWNQVTCPTCGQPTPTNLAFGVEAVPVPASIWALAGAFGLMGILRRRG